jgi:hypothetical protein
LTLKCDEPLSDFAFGFNLRRYMEEQIRRDNADIQRAESQIQELQQAIRKHESKLQAGAYTRPLLGLM